VLNGRVRVWRARKVAQETRHLSRNAAAHVDEAVAGSIALLPWNRFETLLQAKIIEADPAAAEAQAKIFEAERFVPAGTQRGGLKLLVARANAGDVILFMATVNRIAEILRPKMTLYGHIKPGGAARSSVQSHRRRRRTLRGSRGGHAGAGTTLPWSDRLPGERPAGDRLPAVCSDLGMPSGYAYGATYKMIPAIFHAKAQLEVGSGRDLAAADAVAARRAGALIGFAGAIGAFGGVLVNLALPTVVPDAQERRRGLPRLLWALLRRHLGRVHPPARRSTRGGLTGANVTIWG
jgi:hypothetical protein